MKQTLVLFIALVFCINAEGQSYFQFTPSFTDSAYTGGTNQFIDFHLTIHNTSTHMHHIAWKKEYLCTLPSSWQTVVVDHINCNSNNIFTQVGSDSIPAGASFFNIITYGFNSPQMLDAHTTRYTVFDPTDSINSTISVNFKINGGCGATGIAELENNAITVYPTLFTNRVTVESSNPAILQVMVYNSFGQLITTQLPEAENKIQLNTSAWNSGVYFLNIVCKNNTSYRKQLCKQ